jgi:hypothetical protein
LKIENALVIITPFVKQVYLNRTHYGVLQLFI